MNNIIGAVALLSLSVPGFFINSAILRKGRSSESLALSWLTGSVTFTLAAQVINKYLSIPLNLISSLTVFFIITLTAFILARKNLEFPKINFKDNRVLKITLIVFAVLIFITSFFYPVTDWDAVTLYDFRAKILLDQGFLHYQPINMLFAGYPMYTSLLHFWTYVTGLWTAMPIYPLFTISLMSGGYFALRRFSSGTVSLLISIACLAAPRIFVNSFIAYSNLPYSVFLILGAIYIYLWAREGNYRNLLIGIILSASTFWVRYFPFAMVNLGLILLAIPFVKKYSKYLSIAAVLLIISSYFFPLTHPISNYLKWAVYEYYSPYWLVFSGFFIYKLLTKSKDWFWALLYLGYGVGLLVGTYFYNIRFPGYNLSFYDAVQRMMMFINLAVILFVTNLFNEKTS